MTQKQAPPVYYPEAQQKALLDNERLCPTCGTPWNRKAIRACRRCGKAIGRSERWHIVPAGPGLFAYEHRKCPGSNDNLEHRSVETRVYESPGSL